jgi:geranylgeranyl diphosphate synthase type II
MYNFDELQLKVTQKIFDLQTVKEPAGLYEPIDYILNIGGKKLRPVLVLMACNLFTDDIEKATNTALAFEVFHNFTLMHDDLMDNSELRRNQPTVHKKWNADTAVLSGDAMMIKSYELLLKTPENQLKEVIQLFNKTALEVCEGQQFDMEFELRSDVSKVEYINMIRLKTAVLIAACLKTGAVVGQASSVNAEYLYEFGINIGLAFQIQDDLLDVYADTEVFGKKTGNDIINNKKTFLLTKANENAVGKNAEELNYWLNNNTAKSEKKIKAVTELYNKLGIKEKALKEMNMYHRNAVELLEKVGVEEDRKQILYEFTQKLLKRKK